MDTKQHHGIKIGDLVKFKHHIFDEYEPVHLVSGVGSKNGATVNIRLHGKTAYHRANNFVVVRKAKR